MNANRFLDPLYGPISYSSFEAKLLFSPELQRLRSIRLCNINSLLITGASEVSRFEHVVGVMNLAKEWVKQNNIVGDDATVIIAASLLHDVQTGPFGHSLQYIFEDNEVPGDFKHEDLSHGSERLYLQLTNANVAYAGSRFSTKEYLGDLWPRVTDAIAGRGPYGAIISGRVDIDNIDNVVRLAYHSGIADKSDAKICLGLVQDIQLKDSAPSITWKGVEYLTQWQSIRRRLYEVLLHDWAEFSAKAMLTSMMELAVKYELLGADSWVLTDAELFNLFTKETVGETQIIGELARRIMLGDLYIPLGLWRSSDITHYAKLSKASYKRAVERRLMRQLGTRAILHIILDHGKTERKIKMMVRDDGQVHEFGTDTREILIGVFISRDEQSAPSKKKAAADVRRWIEADVGELEELQDPLRPVNADEHSQLSLL